MSNAAGREGKPKPAGRPSPEAPAVVAVGVVSDGLSHPPNLANLPTVPVDASVGSQDAILATQMARVSEPVGVESWLCRYLGERPYIEEGRATWLALVPDRFRRAVPGRSVR
jgi:hypothetical protein